MSEINADLHIDAEFEVIAACLNDAGNLDDSGLAPEDFYDAGCREVFRTMREMQERGIEIDPVLVAEHLPKNGLVNRAGGLTWIGEIMSNAVGSTARLKAYASVVLNHKKTRDLAAAGVKIAEIASARGSDVRQAYSEADELIGQLQAATESKSETVLVNDVLTGYIETIESRRDAGLPGIPTGIDELDRLIGGFQKTKFYILGARPSMGKTAMAIGFGTHCAGTTESAYGKGPHGVLFLEQEMPKVELLDRMFASAGSINLSRLTSGALTEDDYTNLGAALGKLYQLPLWINDEAALTLGRVRAEIRKRKREGNLSVVFIDYLQLMQGPGANRNEQIERISRGLKQLAMEFDVAIVALAQLSRKIEERSDKRPVMSDLRDSGSIEQDADVIMFIYRDEVYNPDTQDVGVAEIIVAKQRNGPKGVVRTHFRGEYSRFDNIRQLRANDY